MSLLTLGQRLASRAGWRAFVAARAARRPWKGGSGANFTPSGFRDQAGTGDHGVLVACLCLLCSVITSRDMITETRTGSTAPAVSSAHCRGLVKDCPSNADPEPGLAVHPEQQLGVSFPRSCCNSSTRNPGGVIMPLMFRDHEPRHDHGTRTGQPPVARWWARQERPLNAGIARAGRRARADGRCAAAGSTGTPPSPTPSQVYHCAPNDQQGSSRRAIHWSL